MGFDVKKAEVQQIMREFDRDGQGLIAERDFTTVGKPLLHPPSLEPPLSALTA